jgi:hypothetical protein
VKLAMVLAMWNTYHRTRFGGGVQAETRQGLEGLGAIVCVRSTRVGEDRSAVVDSGHLTCHGILVST